MKPFGLECGIVGSAANHKSQQQYNAEVIRAQETKIASLQENIDALLADVAEVQREYADTIAATLDFLSGGPATPHVGTGSGSSTSNLRWDGKDTNDRPRLKRK